MWTQRERTTDGLACSGEPGAGDRRTERNPTLLPLESAHHGTHRTCGSPSARGWAGALQTLTGNPQVEKDSGYFAPTC